MAKRRKKKLYKLQLLADLRKLLARSDTQIRLRKLRICGQSEWTINTDGTRSNITIYLDPRRDGRVRLVIHELLHVYFDTRLGLGDKLTYELEEELVLAWERLLYSYLHRSEHEHALELWDRAIRRKLP